MLHRITFLQRLPALKPEAFYRHWSTDHAEIVQRMPGLARYAQNHVVEVLTMEANAAFPIAGIVETWYESPDAANLASSAPVAFAALLKDELHFLAGSTSFQARGENQPADPAWKLWGYAEVNPERLSAAARGLAKGLEGVFQVRNLARDTSAPLLVRPGLQAMHPKPRALFALLFDGETAARRAAKTLAQDARGLRPSLPGLQLLLTREHRLR
ncbi:uncharacterized protein (TIGR02118 family) [Arthrobacter sp. GAS37]|uniref:EthD family reductase n=1 Tax=Arthrobacter sp. GAS37 TaxID=3156261 RepID=UPI00383440E4